MHTLPNMHVLPNVLHIALPNMHTLPNMHMLPNLLHVAGDHMHTETIAKQPVHSSDRIMSSHP